MSFSDRTEKLTEHLIQAEYKNACEKFGEKYNSLHEGYAVLLEEMEEVNSEIADLDTWLKTFWRSVRGGDYYKPIECVEEIKICVENSMKELAQVGAVLMKIENTISEVKKNDR
jgi:hypothetical protein